MAVTLALSMIPLSVAAIGAIDLLRGLSARTHLQDALDAAALAVARSTATNPTEVREIGRKALAMNLGSSVAATSNFSLTKEGVVVATASTVADTAFYKLIADRELTVDAYSEVTRSSANVEMALVLDVTGSMKEEIGSLKIAAKELVDLVVKDEPISSFIEPVTSSTRAISTFAEERVTSE